MENAARVASKERKEEMTKLNPCPQCGNEPDIFEYGERHSHIYCTECDDLTEVISLSASGAINAWNAQQRASSQVKTLRDEFAMHSPFSVREIADSLIAEGVKPTTDVIAAHLAFINYAYADLMLKERSK